MRALLIVLVILLIPPTPARGEELRKSLGDGYELVVDNQSLHVAKGKLRARLVPATGIVKAALDKKTRQVTVDVTDFSCLMETKHSWALGHLDARLENTPAYALHRKKDYKASAAGFARAVAADPAWRIPAINLASAHALLGDQDAAVKALAPWLTSDPIGTYLTIATDPELASIAARPEVLAIRAARPGNAKVTPTGIVGGVAHAKDRGLIAVARTEGSWGSSAFQTDLEIREAATGKLVASTPLVKWNETSNDCYENKGCEIERAALPAVKKRAAALQTLLGQLGFSAPRTEAGTITSDGAKIKASFPRAKLGLVIQDGTARVLQKDTVLGTAGALQSLHATVLVEDPRLVIAWMGRPGAEGCETTDPTSVIVIPLAKP